MKTRAAVAVAAGKPLRSEERRVGKDWSSAVCSSDLSTFRPGRNVDRA